MMGRSKEDRNRRIGRPEVLPPETTVERIAKALEVTPSTLGAAQIELSGNREAVIDGCKGVVEYDTDSVRLAIPNMTVLFRGRGLVMRCLTGESVIIDGVIDAIEFSV